MARASAVRPLRGFTLFEVMAAVLVLGILYTVLIGTQSQGVRAEGESKRRLEASLVADAYLAEIETGIGAGVFPELGTSEEELEGGYRVLVEVLPFDPTPYLGEAFQEQQPEPGDPTPSLLTAPSRPDEGLLRTVSVSVFWLEAEGEHEARRTTLAYDAATIASLFPSEEGSAGAGAGDGARDMSPEDAAAMELLKGLVGPQGTLP